MEGEYIGNVLRAKAGIISCHFTHTWTRICRYVILQEKKESSILVAVIWTLGFLLILSIMLPVKLWGYALQCSYKNLICLFWRKQEVPITIFPVRSWANRMRIASIIIQSLVTMLTSWLYMHARFSQFVLPASRRSSNQSPSSPSSLSDWHHSISFHGPACSSSFPTLASDYGLAVANGTYAVTANRCVQCSCGPDNSE
jgi:hypothetical protein